MNRRNYIRLAVVPAAVAILASSTCSGVVEGTASAAGTRGVALEASTSSASWAAVVAGANKEGKVTFYSDANDSGNDALIAAFNKVYPDIKVNYTRTPSADIAPRILQEAKSGVNALDVVMTGVPAVMAGNGSLFKTLTPSLLPALSAFPKSAELYPWAELTAYNTYAVAYNTTTVSKSQVPVTWKDVLNSTFKGQIAYATPAGAPTELGWLQGMKHYYGNAYLKQFGQMDYQLVDSATPGAQNVASGTDKLAVIVYPSSVTPLISSGAPVKYVIPTPVLVKPDIMSVAAHAPHPDAARVFANFMMTIKGLSVVCKIAATAAPIANVPNCIKIPANAYHVQDLWTTPEETPYLNLVGVKQTS